MTRTFKPAFSNLLRGLSIACVLAGGQSAALADDSGTPVVTVRLGDYRFDPDEITLKAGQPVVLELQNVDRLTPHNLTLRDKDAGLDIDVDVSGGHTVSVELTPRVPGRYPFFCDKKLLFMKSHREHGMEGVLNVVP